MSLHDAIMFMQYGITGHDMNLASVKSTEVAGLFYPSHPK